MTPFVPYRGPIDALGASYVLVRHPLFPFPVCAKVWRSPLGLRFCVMGADKRTEIGVPDEFGLADHTALLAAFAHEERIHPRPDPEKSPLHVDFRGDGSMRFYVEGFDEGTWSLTMPDHARERAIELTALCDAARAARRTAGRR